MNLFQAIFLGLIQGVAEFLPISSSGHLALFQNILGLADVEHDHMFFDVLLHLGTLAAVFVAYWGEIKALVLELFTMVHLRKLPEGEKPDYLSRRLIAFLVVATLPLVAVLPVKDHVEGLFSNLTFIGCALLVTGVLLFLTDRFNRGRKTLKNASLLDALLVGCGQAIAVVPGLSRSGTTITVGCLVGYERSFAVRFSFLMSIPVIGGSLLLGVKDTLENPESFNVWVILAGMISAAVSGYIAVRFMLNFFRKKGMKVFAIYLAILGVLVLVDQLFFHQFFDVFLLG